MRKTNQTFYAKDGAMSIYGCVGKHGEVESATIYSKERPILSLSSDMHRVQDFDGITVINTQGELTQLIGIYYHGDLYPLSRKLICDAIGRMIHLGTDKGRSSRKNLYKLKLNPGADTMAVSDGEVDLFLLRMGNILIHRELESGLFGKDKTFLKIQGRVLIEVMTRPNVKSVVYSRKTRLVSKHEHFEPLAKMA